MVPPTKAKGALTSVAFASAKQVQFACGAAQELLVYSHSTKVPASTMDKAVISSVKFPDAGGV